MSLTTIMFDFFGTLVRYSSSRSSQGYLNSDAVLRSAGLTATYDGWLPEWDATYADFDERTRPDLAEFSMTDVAAAFFARVGLPADSPAVAAFEATYLREWNAGVTDIAGLQPMLAGLAGRYRLGVVSNTNDLTLVPDHLTRLGLADLFDDVVLSVEVGYRKPHPAVYRTALERLDSDPGRTLFVGDTFEADYEGPSMQECTHCSSQMGLTMCQPRTGWRPCSNFRRRLLSASGSTLLPEGSALPDTRRTYTSDSDGHPLQHLVRSLGQRSCDRVGAGQVGFRVGGRQRDHGHAGLEPM